MRNNICFTLLQTIVICMSDISIKLEKIAFIVFVGEKSKIAGKMLVVI